MSTPILTLPSRDAAPILEGSAAVFHGPDQPFLVRRYPVPPPGPGELLVRVTCTTICSSDLHTVHGRRGGRCPCVLGHEIVGTIAAFGPDASLVDLAGQPLRTGDRVTWTLAASCGTCFFCEHGLPQKCESLFKYGHTATVSEQVFGGGYAEYCILVPGTGVLRLPDSLTDALAATANCAGATVAAALRLLTTTAPVKDSTVLVMGAGTLGLMACAMLREAGALEVISCDVDTARATRALEFGATRAVAPDDLTSLGGRGMDAALEFTGSSLAVASAIESLRTGGTAILAGTVLPSPAVPLDPERVVRRMLTIRGLHNYAPGDLAAAVRFLDQAGHRYPLTSLLAESFPLESINEAFAAATLRPGFRVSVLP